MIPAPAEISATAGRHTREETRVAVVGVPGSHREHVLAMRIKQDVAFGPGCTPLIEARYSISAHYIAGPWHDGHLTRQIASFGARIDSPAPGIGYCVLTGGSVQVHEDLRGLGIGSHMQNCVVTWVLAFQRSVPVNRIGLSAADAQSQPEADLRNAFYERFGVRFTYSPPVNGVVRAAGHSDPTLTTADLRQSPSPRVKDDPADVAIAHYVRAEARTAAALLEEMRTNRALLGEIRHNNNRTELLQRLGWRAFKLAAGLAAIGAVIWGVISAVMR